MPQDAKDYDKALLWRGIAQTVGFTADSKAQWTGNLSELLGNESAPVKVESTLNLRKRQNNFGLANKSL